MKVSLSETTPLVWRRILVPAAFTLTQLHDVLQVVMGWKNSHMFQFEIAGETYGTGEPEFEDESEIKQADHYKLSDALASTDQFTYVYDFGDNWRHEVVVEKGFKWDENHAYPACIGGESACPPEDCGGISGYFDFLEKFRNPADEEHLSTRRWVGGFFDPSSFDTNRINQDHLWSREW